MRQRLIILLAALNLSTALLPVSSLAQEPDTARPEQFGLQHLSAYLNLKPDDISFRRDYTEPDTFRLEVVAGLMEHPLQMIDYAQGLKGACVKSQPEILAGILFTDLKTEYQTDRLYPYHPDISEIQGRYNLQYTNVQLNQLLTRAANYIDIVIPRST